MWWSMWCSSLEQPELYATVSLTLRAHDLHVEVGEAAGRGQGQFDHALHGDGVAVQVVEQRAVLVVVGHQPQLSPRPVIYTNTHTQRVRQDKNFQERSLAGGRQRSDCRRISVVRPFHISEYSSRTHRIWICSASVQ